MKQIILIFITFLFAINIFAQKVDSAKAPILYLGAYLGYMANSHSADFNKLEGYPNCCPRFTDGSGSGVGVGLLLEYPLNNWLRITGRFGITGLSGDLAKTEKIGNTEIRRADGFTNGEIADAVSEYSIKSNIQMITIEPGVSYYPINNLSLSTGLRFGFLNNSSFDQSEKLITPNNIVFTETGTRARNEAANQDIPNTNTLQLHTFLGLGYDIPVFSSGSITPELRYYLALNNLSDVDWRVNQLHAGVAVKFPLYKSKKIKQIQELRIIRDTTVNQVAGLKNTEVKLLRTEKAVSKEFPSKNTELELTTQYEYYEMNVPRDARMTAELKITGINRDGSRQINPAIVIEEIETEEGFPLLPYVFFKENDDNLSNSSMKQIESDSIITFDPNKMEWETLDIYSNLLNIVGFRLKNSKSKITLTGTNNNTYREFNNLSLSQRRAESVKNYLVNTWGISSDRISIQSRNLPSKPANNDKPEGKEENQRVEITSLDNAITAPLTLKDIVRIANPPKIQITPDLWSEIGMDKWDISVTQKGEVLRKYSGTGNGNENIWDVEDNPIPTFEEPIEIVLNYTDKSGRTGNIKQDLNISQLTIKKKRFELKDDKRIERFSLILFDYNKSEITEAQKRILQEVKSKIKPNSNVIISGYADRTGEELYNKELAARRNAEVQKVLKINDSQLIKQNIGSSELLYDNSSPEGRSYCRTVKVLVETPIK